MKKIISIGISSALVVLVSGLVTLSKPVEAQASIHGRGLSKIETATLKNPIVSLGWARDPKSGQLVEGLAVVHFKDESVRGGNAAGKPGKLSKFIKCYDFLANGARWKGVEPWLVNVNNNSGLESAFVLDSLVGHISQWEDAADGVIDGSSMEVV